MVYWDATCDSAMETLKSEDWKGIGGIGDMAVFVGLTSKVRF